MCSHHAQVVMSFEQILHLSRYQPAKYNRKHEKNLFKKYFKLFILQQCVSKTKKVIIQRTPKNPLSSLIITNSKNACIRMTRVSI